MATSFQVDWRFRLAFFLSICHFIQVKLSREEVFNNKILFSNKIHAQVLKVTDEILKSFDKFKIEIEDKKLFLNSINHYYCDLCAVIFHLRQVLIQIDDDKESVCDLQEVIIALNKIVLVVQESLNLETEQLIIQIRTTIIDVGPQVEKLMEIIAYDNLHEHKQKILDIQHDLVLSVKALKLYCQSTYLTLSELEGLLHEEIDKTKNNLIQIKTGHEHLTEDFLHYTRHSVQNLQNLVNYWRQQYNHYHNDVANVLKIADANAVSYMNGMLEAVAFDNPISKMLDVIENCHENVSKCAVEFEKALQAVMEKHIGKKDEHVLKQLFIRAYIKAVNAMSGLNQSIEDAIMKK